MRQQQPPPPGRCHRGLRPLSAPHHFCRHYLHHIHPTSPLAPPYPRGAQAAGAATEAGGGRKRALPIGTAQPREEDETTPITRRGPGARGGPGGLEPASQSAARGRSFWHPSFPLFFLFAERCPPKPPGWSHVAITSTVLLTQLALRRRAPLRNISCSASAASPPPYLPISRRHRPF